MNNKLLISANSVAIQHMFTSQATRIGTSPRYRKISSQKPFRFIKRRSVNVYLLKAVVTGVDVEKK